MPNEKDGVFHMDTFGMDNSTENQEGEGVTSTGNQECVGAAQNVVPPSDAVSAEDRLDEFLATMPGLITPEPSHHQNTSPPTHSSEVTSAQVTPESNIPNDVMPDDSWVKEATGGRVADPEREKLGSVVGVEAFKMVLGGRVVDAFPYNGPPIPVPNIPAPKKPGRLPALDSEQVQSILRDNRPLKIIAAEYGVSVPTIRRVKRRGAFREDVYIPADKYVREDVTTEGNLGSNHDDPNTKPLHGENYDPDEVLVGRPYKRRETPLSDREKLDIMMVPRGVRETAEKYGVSTATVSRLRRMTRTNLPYHTTGPKQGQMMTLLEAVLADPRPASVVAAHYGLTPAMVNHLREDATSQGNT